MTGEEIDPVECYEDRRMIDIEAIRDHFGILRKEVGLRVSALRTMEERLLSHLSESMIKYSFTLEFSFSVEDGRFFPYRFSYSFPAYGGGRPEEEKKRAKEIITPFGKDVADRAESILSLADPKLVDHILFGVDARSEGVRLKLYFQFDEGHEKEKLLLLRWLLPIDAIGKKTATLKSLHLLCVDFDADGVTRSKLYYLHNFIKAESIRRRFPENPILTGLLNGPCPDGLRDFQVIRRIGPRGKDARSLNIDVDFSLPKNNLEPEIFMGDIGDDASLEALKKLFSITRGRHLAVKRISTPAKGDGKVNLYYLLLDAPAPEDKHS